MVGFALALPTLHNLLFFQILKYLCISECALRGNACLDAPRPATSTANVRQRIKPSGDKSKPLLNHAEGFSRFFSGDGRVSMKNKGLHNDIIW